MKIRVLIAVFMTSIMFGCKKNQMDCGKSTTTYYNSRMVKIVEYMIQDSKGKDVFKSNYFSLVELTLRTYGEEDKIVEFDYRLDSTENFYTISMKNVSYTREGFPLVLDFGTGRMDTLILKEIGFNSCSGPIKEVEKSSGIKEVTWNKIILDI